MEKEETQDLNDHYDKLFIDSAIICYWEKEILTFMREAEEFEHV